MFYCYLHLRPDNTCFYVGKGSLERAFNFADRGKYHKNVVNKYGRENVSIVTTSCDSEKEAFDLEIAMIALFRRQGVKLANLTGGGEGILGLKRSLETRQKIAASRKGIKFTDEHKRKIGEASRNRSAETREKIGAAGRGRKASEEQKKALSEILSQRAWMTDGEKQKHVSSDQERKALEEAGWRLGRLSHSEATRKAIGQSHVGSKRSEETKQRMRDAWERRKARAQIS